MVTEPENSVSKQPISIHIASLQELASEFKKLQEDQLALFDAIKELTKVVGELRAENQKWYNAGRFGVR